MKAGWVLAEAKEQGWQLHLFDREHRLSSSEVTELLDLSHFAAELLGEGALQVLVAGHPEADLRPLPATPLPQQQRGPSQDQSDILWTLLPQLSQTSPPDLSGGGELLLAGAMAIAPRFDGVIRLQREGKALWAQVSAGEVIALQTTLQAPGPTDATFAGTAAEDPDSFLAAVSETLSRPEKLLVRLASLPARQRIEAATKAQLTTSERGWLIGAELAAAKAFWLGQPVLLIGEHLDGIALALEGQGAKPHRLSSDAAALAALRLIAPLE